MLLQVLDQVAQGYVQVDEEHVNVLRLDAVAAVAVRVERLALVLQDVVQVYHLLAKEDEDQYKRDACTGPHAEKEAALERRLEPLTHRFVILAGDSGSHAATRRAPSLMSIVTTRFANDLEVTSETSVTSRPSTGQRQSSGSASRGASSDPGRRRCSLVPSMSPTNTNGFERSNFTLPGTGRLLNRAVSMGCHVITASPNLGAFTVNTNVFEGQ